MKSLVREKSMSKVSHLRIGMVDSFASAVGPSLIGSMMAEAVNLNISSNVTPQLGEALLAKRLDIVFANDSFDNEPHLIRYELLREPFVLLLPKDVRWDLETPDLAGLARAYPMVRYHTQSYIGGQIEAHCHRLNVIPSRRISVDSTEKLLASVAAGVGWSIGNPLSLLVSGRQSRLIRVAPFPGETFFRRLCVVARRGEFDSLVLRLARLSSEVLSEWIEGELQETFPELYPAIRVAQFDREPTS
jgi:DNA-binding transcriptional LysR family regulator